MNAAALYEIVKDWPKEAWPDHSEYKPAHDGRGDAFVVARAYAPIEAAVMLFESAGIRFLHRQQTPTHYLCIQRGRFDAEQTRINRLAPLSKTWTDLSGGFQPTLIEAIASAIKESKSSLSERNPDE